MTVSGNIEKEVKELLEPENLDDVAVGLPDRALNQIAAQQRLNCATEYQKLSIQAANLRVSVEANKSVGNEKAVSQFKALLEVAEVNAKHLLRSIKTIDKQYPDAKALQQEAVERQLKL